jgi:hypothetical protein
VVFDETHHGMVLRPGVTSLLRRFGLLGALAALLLTGGLLLWRWSSPFVVPPAEASADEAGVINGRAAAVGLVQLVRRHLPASRLAALCVDEWCRTFAARPGTRASDLEAPVREVLARAGRRPHPVAVYRAVCELLKENRWKP